MIELLGSQKKKAVTPPADGAIFDLGMAPVAGVWQDKVSGLQFAGVGSKPPTLNSDGSLQFNGAGGLFATTPSNFAINTDMTFEIDVNIGTLSASRAIFQVGVTTGVIQLLDGYTSAVQGRMYVQTPAQSVAFNSATGDVLYKIVYNRYANTITFYVNGVFVQTWTMTGFNLANKQFTVGCLNNNGSSYAAGDIKMRSFRIYNSVR